jgi:polar amino acid transport system permease protein
MNQEQQLQWWRRPWGVVAVAIGAVLAYRGILALDSFVSWLLRWGESGLFFEAVGDRARRGPEGRPGGTKWDWAYLWAVVPPIFRGILVTVRATLSGFLIAVVLGLFLALARRSTHRILSWPAVAFIEFVRSTPLLVQLYLIHFGLRTQFDLPLTALDSLFIGLGIHYATYCSEAYRAGINSVPKGQWEASTALNLGRVTTWTTVILPQAIPNALPALGNYLVAGFKDAPLGFAIGVTGLLAAAKKLNQSGFTPGTEEYAVVGVAFLVVSIPAAWLIRRLERRVAYERAD